MRFFRPDIERMLQGIALVGLIAAILLPVGWGYEQRQQARAWQETACVYRLREVARETNHLIAGAWRGNACAVLRELGLEIQSSR
jgi:hypothetical protein